MADISAWSPLDESNVAAPPNGWPENQPTSTVNNCARAMMGAIRRWYDTVTAQLSTLTAQMGSYLPLTGGTLSGPLGTTSNMFCNGSFQAGGNITAVGSFNGANLAVSGVITGQNITAAGTISGNAVNASDTIFAGSYVNTPMYRIGNIPFAADPNLAERDIYDTGGTTNISMNTGGLNAYDNVQHHFRSRLGSVIYVIFNPSGTYNISGSWGMISDEAAKSDIASYSRGLSAIQALRPVSYKYTSGPFAGDEVRYGLIAQDARTVVPEMVSEVDFDSERFLSVQPGMLTWILCNAVNELAARVEALETGGA